ncbi:phage holin family protein [Brevibacillus sp. SYSU BS000544]|uniref:phage holin family protein n=1 Tax=Brevibacillus sp. SYSU BS000544 TaxID=3416443 RepID=UPI003CE4E9C8
MSESELLTLVMQNIGPQMTGVYVALLVIGYFLKKTPMVKDWLIPWILVGIGIVLACGVLKGITVVAIIQGVLVAGATSLTHQLWKQTLVKRYEKEEKYDANH